MADDQDFSTDATPTLQQLLEFHIAEFFSTAHMSILTDTVADAVARGGTVADAARSKTGHELGASLETTWDFAKDKAERGMGAALGWLIGEILGVEISPTELFNSRRKPEDSAVGAAIADVAFKAITGTEGELTPSDDGAKRLLGVLAHIITHCWAEGIILEKVEGYTSWSGHIDKISELAKDLVGALGLSRVARTAIRPLVHATITTPLEWKTKKRYRPTLLSEADILKALQRGDYGQAEAAEELARLGYSDKRQDALLKNVMKWLSADDALVLVRAGVYDRQFAIDHLRGAGYDGPAAEHALLVAETKRLENIHDDAAAAVKAAYVDRRIGDVELDNYLPLLYPDDAERAAHEVAFRTMRDVNTKVLSAAQVETCVLAGVLAIPDYRAALQREGYVDEAVIALELLLETKLNTQANVETLRKQKAADAEKAAADKAAAIAQKKADVEKARALAQRGPLAELERAAVRGLIPIARVVDVLRAQYDADTVQIYVDDLTAQRAAYVAQLQKAADAEKAAAVRHIDLGALRAAVLADVLTLDEYRAALGTLKFAPADVDVLTATLRAQKADRDAATKARADALARAARKSIDLGRFEALVRRGHRSLTDYAALLASLGFDAGSVAAMVDLLTIRIADDAAAAKTRAALAAKHAAQGLSLDQIRRAVILGVKTIDDFQRYLVQEKFTVDAQTALVAELRDDVAQADAARARRGATRAGSGDSALPLATVARAARLGIVTPDAYQARLTAAGYTADDSAIELDLLAVEIADVQAQRAKAAVALAKLPAEGLLLPQLAAAVKLGEASLDDYRTRALTLGYAVDDVDTLAAVLADEVQTIQAAQQRHSTIGGQLKARNLSLSELDAAVLAGQLTIDAYTARLVALGFGADDADLLTTLLQLKLDAKAAKGGKP